MTVNEPAQTEFHADRNSLTPPASDPAPYPPSQGDGKEEPTGLNSLQASAGWGEAQSLKPQIEVCCNAVIAAGRRAGGRQSAVRTPPLGDGKGNMVDLGTATMP
ncbi:MAG: hypothetical protein ABSC37_06775 [Xanthobacteraceae bacterium]|jgi:hypothetical protein